MEIYDGVSHSDSGTKTLLFPKWEREYMLTKILQNSTRLSQDNRSATPDSSREAKADVGFEGHYRLVSHCLGWFDVKKSDHL